ncbi:ribosome-associated translation inhibitor RaiA [Candidatus Nomurabacteria bacterium]|nr:ribosome-associated translation inhibitor RaiA [Candidatus Nomurabacteria bacterium]
MSINFQIRTKDLDLTPEITNYIHEKLGVIEKFVSPDVDTEILAQVEVALRSKHHQKGDIYKAEIVFTHDGQKYTASTKAGDVFSAIDELKDEISKRVRRSKNKGESLFRKGARAIKGFLKK